MSGVVAAAERHAGSAPGASAVRSAVIWRPSSPTAAKRADAAEGVTSRPWRKIPSVIRRSASPSRTRPLVRWGDGHEALAHLAYGRAADRDDARAEQRLAARRRIGHPVVVPEALDFDRECVRELRRNVESGVAVAD